MGGLVSASVDGKEYRRQKQLLDAELESLVVPEADAAGHLIEKLPQLWAWASVEDRRRLLVTMLDAIYVDAKEEDRIVAIRPRAPLKPIFQMATMKEGSGIVLVHKRTDDDDDADKPPPHRHEVEADSCSWWRRGRVDPSPSILKMGLFPLVAGGDLIKVTMLSAEDDEDRAHAVARS